MAPRPPRRSPAWQQATGLLPAAGLDESGPRGALVPDGTEAGDRIAVVYDAGDTPPEITVREISGHVHQILADGVAVAIVARKEGRAPTPADVLLVERCV